MSTTNIIQKMDQIVDSVSAMSLDFFVLGNNNKREQKIHGEKRDNVPVIVCERSINKVCSYHQPVDCQCEQSWKRITLSFIPSKAVWVYP